MDKLISSSPEWLRHRRVIALCCIVLLVPALLAACGGDDDSDANASTATTVPAVVTSTSAAPASPTNAPVTSTVTSTIVAENTATPTSAPPSATSAATVPMTATTTDDTLTLSAYFLRDGKIGTAHRVVPHTLQVAAAAMTELLDGPNDAEAAAGLSTAIPEGTTLIGVTIAGDVATVNLSGDFQSDGDGTTMSARLAQVVYTLTQFPTIRTVTFMLDGTPVDTFGTTGIVLDQPVGRADFEDVTPAIFVESPAVGDQVASPVRVWGTANTFEAAFMVKLVGPDGATLFEAPAQATSGSGTRGTFDLTFTWSPAVVGAGTLSVWENSAKDGSPVNVVEIPVTLGE